VLAEESTARDGPDYAVTPLLRDLVESGRNFASLNAGLPAAAALPGDERPRMAAHTA
jgi:hypothetical protein